MRIEVAAAAGSIEDVGIAVVGVAVLEAACHRVGEGLLHARPDRPAMRGIFLLHAGVAVFEFRPGEGPAARAVDERSVEGIAEARAHRAAPVRLRLVARAAGGEALVVEVVLDVGFNAVDPAVVEEIVAGIGAEREIVEALVYGGRRAAGTGIRPSVTGVHADIEAAPVIDAGGRLDDRRFHRRLGNGHVGGKGR